MRAAVARFMEERFDLAQPGPGARALFVQRSPTRQVESGMKEAPPFQSLPSKEEQIVSGARVIGWNREGLLAAALSSLRRSQGFLAAAGSRGPGLVGAIRVYWYVRPRTTLQRKRTRL